MQRLGAYGLALDGVSGAGDLLVPAPPGWLPWTVVRREGHASADGVVGEDRASFGAAPDGAVVVDRASATSTITMPRPPADRELVHPYLAPTAAVVAHWNARASFHAGGVAAGGGVWGLLGERGAGKSTLLAHLAGRGVAVVCDDLLVVDGEKTAYAGPRCVDLRADAASTLGVGEPLGVVGTRERWRVRLPAVPAEAPLRGWVLLRQGDAPAVRRVPPAERLPRLLDNVAVAVDDSRLANLLELASAPMLELTRPREFDALGAVADALLAAVS